VYNPGYMPPCVYPEVYTPVYASPVLHPVYMPPCWFKAGLGEKGEKRAQDWENNGNKVDKCA